MFATQYFKNLTKFIPLCSTLISLQAHALHANRDHNRMPEGDLASHSVVRVLVGNSSCSGSFLSKRTILTAAHCVDLWGEGEKMQVMTYDGSQPKGLHEFEWNEASVESHPSYDFSQEQVDMNQIQNDLAVITVKTPIPEAKPIFTFADIGTEEPFLDYMSSLEGQNFYIAGNGSRQRLFPNGLRAAIDMLRGLTKVTTAVLEKAEGTTLNFSANDRTKVCKGDSGGPAFLKTKDGRMLQVGVASVVYAGRLWAKACGKRSIYVAIGGEHLNWIKESQARQEANL